MREKRKKKKEKRGAEKRGFFLFSLFFFLFSLSACKADLLPARREVENMALMRTMGVDGGAGDGVTVTLSGGTQSKGPGEGEEPPLVLSGQSGTISGACLAMQSKGKRDLFSGHVGQLLVGEDLAREGVSEVLEYVERDIEMRLDTEFYVVKGATAAQAIALGAGAPAAEQLEALEEAADLLPASMPRTVKDVLADLAQDGAALVPALTVGGNGEELLPAGYAILKEDTLAGWAEGEAARGVNLILERTDADMVELPAGGGSKVALRLVGAKTDVRPVFYEDTLVGLEVLCRVEANVAQARLELNLKDEENREALCAGLAAVIGNRVDAALALAQGLDADFLGLGKKAGLAAPWHWAEIQARWEADFSDLPIAVTVETEIFRGYDMK